MQGKFISIEGVDGAGKSSHLVSMVNYIKTFHTEVVLTREPGGTPLGEKIRELLLHEEMHPETEALLMFSARREHIDKVIMPALVRGSVVLSDRFTDSSFAYQCGGRGMSNYKMRSLEDWVTQGLKPDLTLFFDLPVAVSLARLADARAPDKFELQGEEFFTKVRNAYLDRVAENPERFVVINASQSIDLVWKEVQSALLNFMM